MSPVNRRLLLNYSCDSWWTLFSVAQHPRTHGAEGRCAKHKPGLSFEVVCKLVNPTKSLRVKESQFIKPSPVCGFRAANEGTETFGSSNTERLGVVLTFHGPSSARSSLHTYRLHQGMELEWLTDWSPGSKLLRVEKSCYERGSLCVLRWLRERKKSFTLSIKTLNNPHSAFQVRFMLDGKRVFIQPNTTDWMDWVATYNSEIIEGVCVSISGAGCLTWGVLPVGNVILVA